MTVQDASIGRAAQPARPQRPESVRRLRGSHLLLARAAWLALAAAAMLLFLVSLGPFYRQVARWQLPPGFAFDADAEVAVRVGLDRLGISTRAYALHSVITSALASAVFVWVALLIFRRASGEVMPLLSSLALIMFGTASPGTVRSLEELHPAWATVADLHEFLGIFPFLALFYIFPDGRFVPRWTAPLATLYLLLAAFAIFLPDTPLNPENWPLVLNYGALFTFFGTIAFSQIYRYYRVSDVVERQQTKWIVFGIVTALVVTTAINLSFSMLQPLREPGIPAALFDIIGRIVAYAMAACVPLAIGFALLRYRLFDVDVLINRTLVYGGLTAAVVGIYALVVGLLGSVVQARGNVLVSAAAIGLAAVLMQPLRARLQRAVNHLTYGERDEPYRVLSRLGRRLDETLAPDLALRAVVETVATALRLPHAAILLRQPDGPAVAAAYGDPVEAALTLPLTYQGDLVGELVLTPRAPGESFTAKDRQLLDDLARHAGVAAHALRLTADLQRSRERLVTAREEERRRLRRDLHDGHLPVLAGLALQLDATRVLISRDPDRAARLLSDVSDTLREAGADLRRLVYALRPPALDQFGLSGALRDVAATFTATLPADHGAPLPAVTFDLPDALPSLPAAVEVAAYRIASEAITNAIRHSAATTCWVRLWLTASAAPDSRPLSAALAGGALHVAVTDDGRGVSRERRAGVGLSSMRERAEELGGEFQIQSGPDGGTRVYACLPLPGGAAAGERG